MKYLTVISFVLFSCSSFSQNQNKIWYFGYGAGMDFNGGSPVSIGGGNVNAYEGCAVQCDKISGQLVFYTDGITVWAKNHAQMPSGFGLFGDNYSSASALIVPKPGSNSLYYIFTGSGTWGFSGPASTLSYSVVDMTLNSGMGDITTKNQLLLTPSAEKLTAVYHCNGVDVWVVAHGLNSNNFYAYLITSSGIGAPVISATGSVHSDGKGYMKASPNGKKIGLAANSSGLGGGVVELLDFNVITGIVSNPVSLPPDPCNYGVSFSPDNSKFYVTGFENCMSEDLYQYDVSSGVAATIIASKTFIATDLWFGSLQNAPDGKIYVALDYNDLGVINNPNASGTACNYVSAGFSVGVQSSHGLPYFIESYFNQPAFTINTSSTPANCAGNTGTATASVSGGTPPYTYTWNTSPPQNTQTATGLSGGIYSVTVSDAAGCLSSIATVTVTSSGGGFTLTSSQTNASCFGSANASATVTPTGGVAPYTYAWSTNPMQTLPAVTGISAGSYTCIITDGSGCVQTHIITITEPQGMSISTSSTPASCGLTDGNATVSASGGAPSYSYLWLTNPVQTGQTAVNLAIGTYTVIVTDGNGCAQQQATIVTGNMTPVADFTISPDIVYVLDPVFFTDLSSYASNWLWYFNPSDSADTSTVPSPSHIYPDTGIFCATLIVSDPNKICFDTITKCVKIIESFTFYIPNSFSPNGDDLNEFFLSFGTNITEFKMEIFDRWGNLLFESNNINKGWNGKVSGGSNEIVQEDVYVWKVGLTDNISHKYNYIGHVSVVK